MSWAKACIFLSQKQKAEVKPESNILIQNTELQLSVYNWEIDREPDAYQAEKNLLNHMPMSYFTWISDFITSSRIEASPF